MPSGRSRQPVRRSLAIGVAALAALLLSACSDAERLAQIVPRLTSPGARSHPVLPQPPSPPAPTDELPPRQPNGAFDFEPAGTDEQGHLLYHVRIRPGGSPYLVSRTMLTPLFQLDGKDAAAYVNDAYFRAHPDRTPSTIQPGDEFVLPLPSDAFLVRWQEEREERFGHRGRLREYVSERGDRLFYYLTDPFPIRYELQPAESNGRGTIQFHPDLAFLLESGRTDPLRLAQLVYRVPDPDIFQVEAMRTLVATVRPGVGATLELERTHTHLDPVRDVLPQAIRMERVPEPERAYLQRAVFAPDSPVPFVAVEDALGTHMNLVELPDGRVFRIEYYRDATVRVFYKTGPDDALGKRNPYQLRENGRWSTLYQTLAPSADSPIKWGPGEPADLEPFPTARDPHQHAHVPKESYDYLVPGRALVLTFRPLRFKSDLRASIAFSEILGEIRERYRGQIEGALNGIEWLQKRATTGNQTASANAPRG
jgi:hypothetical protein